jgi:hypothetical protein
MQGLDLSIQTKLQSSAVVLTEIKIIWIVMLSGSASVGRKLVTVKEIQTSHNNYVSNTKLNKEEQGQSESLPVRVHIPSTWPLPLSSQCFHRIWYILFWYIRKYFSILWFTLSLGVFTNPSIAGRPCTRRSFGRRQWQYTFQGRWTVGRSLQFKGWLRFIRCLAMHSWDFHTILWWCLFCSRCFLFLHNKSLSIWNLTGWQNKSQEVICSKRAAFLDNFLMNSINFDHNIVCFIASFHGNYKQVCKYWQGWELHMDICP